MFVVAAYGKIFPKIWLDLPTLGTINVHFSLLPKYRGSLCVSEPLKNLESQTGITIMEMDEQLDHGKIIAQAALPIGLNDNTAILTKKLTQLASKVLPAVLTSYANWKKSTTNTITLDDDVCLFLPPLEQDESKAIITPSHRKRNRSTSFIPWSIIKAAITNTDPDVEALQAYLDSFAVPYSPKGLHALIRSLDPDPRAWTTVNHSGKSIDLNLIQTNFFPDTNEFQLQLVQPTGKNPMPFKQFLAGNPILES
jgi:methionyl-tRNA formyltransferase